MAQKVRIHVKSFRYKLTDADGICAKWTIDGIVDAGILEDDRPEIVETVTHSQEQISKNIEEFTVITIREV